MGSRKDDTKKRKSSPEKDYHSNKSSSSWLFFARCWVLLRGVVYFKIQRQLNINDQYCSLGFQISSPKDLTWAGIIWKTMFFCMSQEVAHWLAQLKLFVWVVRRPMVQWLVMSCKVAVDWPCNSFRISCPAVRLGLASLESQDQSLPAGSRDLHFPWTSGCLQ